MYFSSGIRSARVQGKSSKPLKILAPACRCTVVLPRVNYRSRISTCRLGASSRVRIAGFTSEVFIGIDVHKKTYAVVAWMDGEVVKK